LLLTWDFSQLILFDPHFFVNTIVYYFNFDYNADSLNRNYLIFVYLMEKLKKYIMLQLHLLNILSAIQLTVESTHTIEDSLG
jgi:hypothetical protein